MKPTNETPRVYTRERITSRGGSRRERLMYTNIELSTRTNSLRPCDDGGKASATDGDVGVARVRQKKGGRYMGAVGASAYTVAKWFAGRMRGAVRGAAMVCNAMDRSGEHIVVER